MLQRRMRPTIVSRSKRRVASWSPRNSEDALELSRRSRFSNTLSVLPSVPEGIRIGFHQRASGSRVASNVSACTLLPMGNSGEKRKGRRHLLKVGTKPNRDQMHSEEQREIGRNSLIGIAVVIVVTAVVVAAFWLFR